MSERAYTDDDVDAACDALWDAHDTTYHRHASECCIEAGKYARAVLTAVAPAIAARAREAALGEARDIVATPDDTTGPLAAARNVIAYEQGRRDALREAADVDCDYCRTTKACDAYRRGRADALREAADEWTDDSPMATGVALSAKRRNKMMRALKDVGWCAWYRPPIVAAWLRARAEAVGIPDDAGDTAYECPAHFDCDGSCLEIGARAEQVNP